MGDYLHRQSPFMIYGNQQNVDTLGIEPNLPLCKNGAFPLCQRPIEISHSDSNRENYITSVVFYFKISLVNQHDPTYTARRFYHCKSSPRLARTVNFRVRAECITIILQGNNVLRRSYFYNELYFCGVVASFVTMTIILLVNRISK